MAWYRGRSISTGQRRGGAGVERGFPQTASGESIGRQGCEIGLDVEHVLDPHMGIGRVGKGRDEVGTCRRYAALHRVDEVEIGPGAQPGLGIGSQIGRIEGSHGCLERKSAGRKVRIDVLEIGAGLVAGPATGSMIEDLAVGGIWLMLRQVCQRQPARRAQQPEGGQSQRCQQRQDRDVAFGQQCQAISPSDGGTFRGIPGTRPPAPGRPP